jgi:hypothetical protein
MPAFTLNLRMSSFLLGFGLPDMYSSHSSTGNRKRVFNALGVFSFSSLLLVSEVCLVLARRAMAVVLSVKS